MIACFSYNYFLLFFFFVVGGSCFCHFIHCFFSTALRLRTKETFFFHWLSNNVQLNYIKLILLDNLRALVYVRVCGWVCEAFLLFLCHNFCFCDFSSLFLTITKLKHFYIEGVFKMLFFFALFVFFFPTVFVYVFRLFMIIFYSLCASFFGIPLYVTNFLMTSNS